MVRGRRTPGTSQKPGESKQSVSPCLSAFLWEKGCWEETGDLQEQTQESALTPSPQLSPQEHDTTPGRPRNTQDTHRPEPAFSTLAPENRPHIAVQRARVGRTVGPPALCSKQEGTDCSDIWTPVRCDLDVRAPPCRGGLGPVGPTHLEPQVRECEPRAHSERC